MHALLKKIHIYLGLLNFSIVVVFGIAGLVATVEAETAEQSGPPPVRYVDFTFPAALSDKELADRIYETLKIPLTMPVPNFAIRRNGNNLLVMNFYVPSGPIRVTALEKENRLKIETMRNSLWRYLNNLHSTTSGNRNTDLRIRMWTWYNELSIWSLIAMSVTGVYLWLASRPGFRWAQFSFAAGCGVFLVLYAVTR